VDRRRHRVAAIRSVTVTPPSVTFRTLTQHECVALLGRHDVGRLAFVVHGRPEIVPLNYVHEAGRIYGRTSATAMLAALEPGAWVAFEVDEVRGPYDWWSVIAHGTFHRLDLDGSLGIADIRDAACSARVMHLLRDRAPEAFTTDDPASHRTLLFRIVVGTMTGRAASAGPAASTGAPDGAAAGPEG